MTQPAGQQPDARRGRPLWPWIALAIIAALVIAEAIWYVVLMNGKEDSVAAPEPQQTTEPAPAPAPSPDPVPDPGPVPDPVPSPDPDPDSDASGDGPDYATVFAERDAWLAAQGQDVSSGVLRPATAEQQAFIDAQSAYVEEQTGQSVTEQMVSVWLGLTFDACETSILNSHSMTDAIYDTHVASSPLISTLVGDPADDELMRNTTDVMIYGMSFICPVDYPQWQGIWNERYQQP